MKINNCKQLLERITGERVETEDRAKQLMEKIVFKYTECGCVFDADENGVYVRGYAEGHIEAELPTNSLDWGFTIEEYNDALDQADAEGVMAWNEANDEDYYGLDVDGAADFFEPTKVDTTNMITEEEWNEERKKTDLGDN